ncbi:DUF305 domain-containing protein [Pengzhenrongella sicca]|uniref:DUF305 domain-containing protein n=1 Tax=Pengzhenrongella sicca TaxID=2819238 RepID=A0A8A4Z8F2_9MICO|nr:DUF305 domain-containing protein [Pengzhenrongella sicca]QTE28114.1 DUF305 domain-containing protein [Pengzhenrongella sicca]
MDRRTLASIVGGALVLAVALSSCAGGSSEPAAGGGSTSTAPQTSATPALVDDTRNAVDVEFTQNMVVHHEGAILMANMASRMASSSQVKALGERISAAQEPEIVTMKSWLVEWGEQSAAEVDMDGMDMGGMDMGGMDMGGMSQDDAMADLKSVDGTAFDRRFLELMIEHHRGALAMTATELAAGTNPQARALAQVISDAQTVEITEMDQLLQTLPIIDERSEEARP